MIPFLPCPRTVIDFFSSSVCFLGVIAVGICRAVVILVKDLIFMVLLLALFRILVKVLYGKEALIVLFMSTCFRA